MSQRILIQQSHPDASNAYLCQSLADNYSKGDQDTGHMVRLIEFAL